MVLLKKPFYRTSFSEKGKVTSYSVSRRMMMVGMGAGLAAAFGGAAASAHSSGEMAQRDITDCRGRHVVVGTPQRIACIGGAITETLYALGAQDRIVAVDTTSTWPIEALQKKKSLGYMRTVSAEGVLSLQPDLVLSLNDAGPPTAIEQLMASSVPVVMVDSTPTPETILNRTRFLATIINSPKEGDALCQTISEGFDALAQWRRALPTPPLKVLFVMSMQNGRPMVAGTGTAADSMIKLTGCVNAAGSMHGYKMLNDEALIPMAPQVVLLMAQSASRIQSELLGSVAFQQTPAGQSKGFVPMEGGRMLGFGPDTPHVALELSRRLSMFRKPA
ncbi:hemin ABC transporter substrate-binding protein [Acetobacter tropicalis]|uniref:Hemin ABC transporter substrate-binding protein n=1 Tax=Acetobacter tropicalis TaxID=104102 RepID=A0A511FKL1_9PROT|nr:hemin ABC transporter substrate-binding protein [Acetobacter tropicalis]